MARLVGHGMMPLALGCHPRLPLHESSRRYVRSIIKGASMKKVTLSGLVAAVALVGASQFAQAADGEISFEGTIVNSTCAIEVGNGTGGARAWSSSATKCR
jgi:hypothetical protein